MKIAKNTIAPATAQDPVCVNILPESGGRITLASLEDIVMAQWLHTENTKMIQLTDRLINGLDIHSFSLL